MKKLFILLLAAGLFTSCNNNKGKNDRTDRDTTKTSKDDYNSGDKTATRIRIILTRTKTIAAITGIQIIIAEVPGLQWRLMPLLLIVFLLLLTGVCSGPKLTAIAIVC